jgi:DNA polymerase-3 subunit gamma/tau
LLSLSPKKLTADLLDEVLPPAQDEQIFELLRHAADGDAASVLGRVEEVLAQGRALETFCNDMIEVVRSLMLVRAAGDDTDLIDVPAASREEYATLSRRFELSHYVQMIAMLEELRRNVRFSGAGRALTDALMVRFSKMCQWSSIEQLLADGPRAEKKKNPPPVAAAEARPRAPAPRPPAESPPRVASLDATAPPIGGDRLAPDPAAQTPRPISEPVSSDQAARIKKDPLVRQVMELFDGTVSNIERKKDTS